jgi:hypothetical protein
MPEKHQKVKQFVLIAVNRLQYGTDGSRLRLINPTSVQLSPSQAPTGGREYEILEIAERLPSGYGTHRVGTRQ